MSVEVREAQPPPGTGAHALTVLRQVRDQYRASRPAAAVLLQLAAAVSALQEELARTPRPGPAALRRSLSVLTPLLVAYTALVQAQEQGDRVGLPLGRLKKTAGELRETVDAMLIEAGALALAWAGEALEVTP